MSERECSWEVFVHIEVGRESGGRGTWMDNGRTPWNVASLGTVGGSELKIYPLIAAGT